MKNTTKAKAAAIVLILAMALSLTACGHEHVWQDATCTAPKTCTVCGKTEGETLPHTWEDATCAAPKTCSVCKETEGEALPHTWREANFQAPQTCTVCGATEGDVLTPDFVTHNITLTELGETHDINLVCYTNKSKSTVAHVTVTDFQIFESSDEFPAKEGYEYRQATFTLFFDDENAWKYGVGGWHDCYEDYYDIEYHDDNAINEDDKTTYKAIFNGEEIEYYIVDGKGEWGDWVDKTLTGKATLTIQVPVGYDGYVHGIFNNSVKWPEGGYIYDAYDPDTFFMFRFA